MLPLSENHGKSQEARGRFFSHAMHKIRGVIHTLFYFATERGQRLNPNRIFATIAMSNPNSRVSYSGNTTGFQPVAGGSIPPTRLQINVSSKKENAAGVIVQRLADRLIATGKRPRGGMAAAAKERTPT